MSPTDPSVVPELHSRVKSADRVLMSGQSWVSEDPFCLHPMRCSESIAPRRLLERPVEIAPATFPRTLPQEQVRPSTETGRLPRAATACFASQPTSSGPAIVSRWFFFSHENLSALRFVEREQIGSLRPVRSLRLEPRWAANPVGRARHAPRNFLPRRPCRLASRR